MNATLEAVNTLPESERPRVAAGGQVLEGREEEVRNFGAELITGLNMSSAQITDRLTSLLDDERSMLPSKPRIATYSG